MDITDVSDDAGMYVCMYVFMSNLTDLVSVTAIGDMSCLPNDSEGLYLISIQHNGYIRSTTYLARIHTQSVWYGMVWCYLNAKR